MGDRGTLVHRGVSPFSLRAVACISAGLAVSCAALSASAEGGVDRTPHPALVNGTTAPAHASSIPAAPCGQAGPETLAQAVGLVGMRIYAREVSGPGVLADQSQVEQDIPLLTAMARGNRSAVKKAVTSLVFSHTHVVRLRVMRRNVVVADVGGRYILAPVGGALIFDGRVVGHYLLSVQDDVGYVKLETRFLGVPLVLIAHSRRIPLQGTLAPRPATVPEHGRVSYRGTSYESFSFRAEAFPRGTLRISLLVPLSKSLFTSTCAEIKLSALARIAQRMWLRYALIAAPPADYVNAIQSLTGGLTYIRSGAQQIAGSTEPGPPSLPNHGTVDYGGVTYGVSSFIANTTAGQVRVYQLVTP